MSGRWVREGRARKAVDGEPPPAPELVRPLGQGVALAHWQRLARRLAMPHAFVVEGAPGSGKSTVLRWLAAALCCPSDLDVDEPCGTCRTCRRIASGAHPDLHVVARAANDREVAEWKWSFFSIKVEQIRQLQDELVRRPEGRARVVLIADADRMVEEAQNALLKTLEEPGDATFLLLEASGPERLLPTVLSRSQRLRLLPLDDATIRAQLERAAPARAAWFPRAIGVARGSLGRARMACTERAVQVHDLVQRVLEPNNSLGAVAAARAALEGGADRRDTLEAAEFFLWLLRAEVRRRYDALAAGPAGFYSAAAAEPWTTWLESTMAAERDLALQIPPEQVLVACLVAGEIASSGSK